MSKIDIIQWTGCILDLIGAYLLGCKSRAIRFISLWIWIIACGFLAYYFIAIGKDWFLWLNIVYAAWALFRIITWNLHFKFLERLQD